LHPDGSWHSSEALIHPTREEEEVIRKEFPVNTPLYDMISWARVEALPRYLDAEIRMMQAVWRRSHPDVPPQ
jgi:hypothetical protein